VFFFRFFFFFDFFFLNFFFFFDFFLFSFAIFSQTAAPAATHLVQVPTILSLVPIGKLLNCQLPLAHFFFLIIKSREDQKERRRKKMDRRTGAKKKSAGPLVQASLAGHLAAVRRMLLACPALANATYAGSTALMGAAEVRGIILLLFLSAPLDARSNSADIRVRSRF
jgi:hypothetical protein